MLHTMLGEHAADRLDPEPVPVVVDERDYHGSRGSSSRAKKLDAASRISLARFSSRTSACNALIVAASVVVVPARFPVSMWCCFTQPRSVSGTTPTRSPMRLTSLIHRQRRVLRHRLRHQPQRPVTQLLRILPLRWQTPPPGGIRPRTNPGRFKVPLSPHPRSLDPPGAAGHGGSPDGSRALNAFAITFEGRLFPSSTL